MSLGRAAHSADTASSGAPCGATCRSFAAAEVPHGEEGEGGGWRWEAVEQLVVYGLGSMEDSVVSRCTLAAHLAT